MNTEQALLDVFWQRFPRGSIDLRVVEMDETDVVIRAELTLATNPEQIITALGAANRKMKDGVARAESAALLKALERAGCTVEPAGVDQPATVEPAATVEPDRVEQQAAQEPNAVPITGAQIAAIKNIATRSEWTDDDLLFDLQADYPDVARLEDLTYKQAGDYIKLLQQRQREPAEKGDR
jgi:hypothetical protein